MLIAVRFLFVCALCVAGALAQTTPTPGPTTIADLPCSSGSSSRVSRKVMCSNILYVNEATSYWSYGNNIFNALKTYVDARLKSDSVCTGAHGVTQVNRISALPSDLTPYTQIWVYDLDAGGTQHADKWASIATWFEAGYPAQRQDIILDGRILSSAHGSGAVAANHWQIFYNYFENLRNRGGGLMLGTDHGGAQSLACGSFTCGTNTVTAALNIGHFWGSYRGPGVAYVDVGSPLMNYPLDASESAVARGKAVYTCVDAASCVVGTVFDRIVWDHTSTSQTAIGLQPNGMTFYAVAFHSQNTAFPAISSTIRGMLNFQIALDEPSCDQCYEIGTPATITVAVHVPSIGPYTGWTAQHLGGGANAIPSATAFTVAADGLSATITTLPLAEGDHGFEVQVTDGQGAVAIATVRVSVRTSCTCTNPVDLLFVIDESDVSTRLPPPPVPCAGPSTICRAACSERCHPEVQTAATLAWSASQRPHVSPPLPTRPAPRPQNVGSANFDKTMAFVQNMVTRFRVGPGAHDGQIGVVTFATLSVKAFDLNDHQTNSDVISALGQMQQACAGSMCGRCPGYAMKLASDQVLCSNCPGRPPRLAPITAIFLTASDPGLIAPCDSANGNQGMDRVAEIMRFKGLVERVIPVGIGSAVSGAYLQGLAKNMPIQSSGANYLTAEYANLASITGVITDAACPLSPPTMMPTAYPTAFPTAAPSDAPTTEPSYAPSPQPTKQPTFNCQECTAAQKLLCDMAAGRPGTCGFTSAVCNVSYCGCEGTGGFTCSGVGCPLCTVAPTLAPTSYPTAAPSHNPTAEPSAAPSTAPSSEPTTAPTAPTKAPTYWDLFQSGTEDKDDAAASTAAGVTAAALGTVAIILIVLGIIACVVLLILVAAGVGIFAARKKLFETQLTVDGKTLEKSSAISVGHQIEMSETVATGMLARGEISEAQFADMGFGSSGAFSAVTPSQQFSTDGYAGSGSGRRHVGVRKTGTMLIASDAVSVGVRPKATVAAEFVL